MITGRELIQKYYSDNEYYENERLYSTGDSELDDLLERAFCDGYEYAQKEFVSLEEFIFDDSKLAIQGTMQRRRNYRKNRLQQKNPTTITVPGVNKVNYTCK